MSKTIVLERSPIMAFEADPLTGRQLSEKKVKIGENVISVELADLLDMMKRAAKEKEINLSTCTIDAKRELLKGMGYEKYFNILRQEAEFSWL